MARILNYIAGEWAPSSTGRSFEDRSPADPADVIAEVPDSGTDDVERAVRAARKAFPAWSRTPAPRRAELLYRAAELLTQEKEEIARLMTREMGKILLEARGDVQEAIDTAYYAAGEGRRLFGETTTSELPDKFAMSVRCPIGVCGIVTPWNFPVAIPAWKMFPALLCGNTIVFKPASDTPAVATRLVEVLARAGFPAGVVNLVHGGGRTVGGAIVEHPDVNLISFTGSSETGKDIAQKCGRTLKRCSLELGGKNGMVVMEDADLDLALDGALWGAFGTTGQRCTATSRLILHGAIHDRFLERLTARARELRIGNGLEPATEMGPLVNEPSLEKVARYVEIGKQEGARLCCGGERVRPAGAPGGHFFAPTIFAGVRPDMRIAVEEIFGPVLVVLEVKSFEEAIAVLNGTRFGLSSSIYTSDVNRAFRAIRDIEAGITYVNGPTIGAEVHLPFGGVKETGNGHREAGPQVYDVFSEWKAVYVDYSGKLQKAQIDTHKE
jgi:aldehyde dehydrogenase (NAD+)